MRSRMMRELRLTINGREMPMPEGITVLSALARSGTIQTRTSSTGELRGPLCGMGICYECRLTVDGVADVKACQRLCRDGMRIETP
jgi:D-hydroxyproline dehydrogenase subunit gamma